MISPSEHVAFLSFPKKIYKSNRKQLNHRHKKTHYKTLTALRCSFIWVSRNLISINVSILLFLLKKTLNPSKIVYSNSIKNRLVSQTSFKKKLNVYNSTVGLLRMLSFIILSLTCVSRMRCLCDTVRKVSRHILVNWWIKKIIFQCFVCVVRSIGVYKFSHLFVYLIMIAVNLL